MAAIINHRDVLLQAAGTRLLPIDLPSNYTYDGTPITGIRNTSVTLSSTGALQNAGGGQITNGASIGSLNAGNITTGTLSTARIGAGSITTDKLSVSTLSAITANLGSVTAGTITSTANIDISGRGLFNGAYTSGGNNAALHANGSGSATYGLVGIAGSAGAGVFGIASSSSRAGVSGWGTASGSVGVSAIGSGGGVALNVNGTMTITTQTISNLTAGVANSVAGANVTGTVANATNASQLGAVAASGWCRGIACDVGTATATGFGFGLVSTVSGVETSASGNNITIRTISDRRKKTDINAEELGLEFVGQLTPVTYRMKDSPTIKHHGFIAQDIEKIIGVGNDALAQTHDDGMKGTDYMSLVGVLVKAIQELNEKVQVLTNEKGLNK